MIYLFTLILYYLFELNKYLNYFIIQILFNFFYCKNFIIDTNLNFIYLKFFNKYINLKFQSLKYIYIYILIYFSISATPSSALNLVVSFV